MKLRTTYRKNDAWGFSAITTDVDYVRHILGKEVTYGTDTSDEKFVMSGECDHERKIDRWGYESDNPHLISPDGKCANTIMLENGHKLAPRKDANQTRVYKLEDPLRSKGRKFEIGDFTGVTEMIGNALNDLRFDKCELPKLNKHLAKSEAPLLKFSPSTRISDAAQFGWTIRLSKSDWAWQSMVIWHELTHLLVPNNSAHDGLFTQTMINLVTKFESKQLGYDLADAFMKGGKIQGRGKYVSQYHIRDGRRFVSRTDYVPGKPRKFTVEVASPKYGLARFGSQTGFSL